MTLSKKSFHDFIKGHARGAISRGFGVAAVFSMNALISRIFINSEAGAFFVGLAILHLLAILCRFGLDNVIIKKVSGIDLNRNPTEGFLVWFESQLFLFRNSIIVGAVGVVAYTLNLAFDIKQSASFPFIFLLGWFLVFSYASIFVLASFLKGSGKVGLGSFLETGCVPLLMCLLLVSNISPATHQSLLIAYSIISLLSVTIVAVILFFGLYRIDFRMIFPVRFFIKSGGSFHLMQSSAMEALITWFPAIILGYVGTSSDVVIYNAAARISGLINFIVAAGNLGLVSQIAKLCASGRYSEAFRLVRDSSRKMVFLVFPIYIFAIFGASYLLKPFGIYDSQAVMLLRILSTGYLSNVIAGSIGYVFIMGKRESAYRNIVALSLVFIGFGGFLMCHYYGAVGLASAVFFSVIAQNITLYIFAKIFFK